MQVLMVAAENDAVRGMKVGGMADVVRDAPSAWIELNQTVDVVVPAIVDLPGLTVLSVLSVNFTLIDCRHV